MPISVQFSAPEFHTWRRIEKWPANVTNMNTNITMTIATMTVAAVMNITNITITTIATMIIAAATTTAAIATKVAPATAEKTVMKSKKSL